MFLFLGGMPEVVQTYILNDDIAEVRNIQTEILNAYKRDFSKYTTAALPREWDQQVVPLHSLV